MQKESDGTITQMDADEIILFHAYQAQHNSPNGRDRDDLPFTPEYQALRSAYNTQAGQNLSDRDFWLKLKYVLKYGVPNITRYLAAGAGGGGGQLAAGS